MSTTPVFFDPHGKRKRVFSRSVLLVIAASVSISILFAITVLVAPSLAQPLTGQKKHSFIPGLGTKFDRKFALARAKLATEIAKEKGPSRGQRLAPGSPIMAAFYAPWQETGLFSLRANKDKITHLMPEWVHLNADGASLDFTSDFDPSITPHNTEVMRIASDEGIRVLPILNNGLQGKFDPDRVHRLLASPANQIAVATEMRDWLLENSFAGVNLDLENLNDADYAKVPDLVQQFQNIFKPVGLRVTMDLEVGNDSIPIKKLGELCDWIVIMAYDEHSEESTPGPIASVDWSEQVLQKARDQIPANKLIVGIGNYAYDWTQGKPPAESLTYQEALALAQGYRDEEKPEDVIRMDGESVNPTFNYSDDDGKEHQVWMLDAVTAFNKWKLAQQHGFRGAAVWAMGQEDPSIWKFLDRSKMDAPPDPGDLEDLEFPYEPVFKGVNGKPALGEVLRVVGLAAPGARSIDIDPTTGLIIDEAYTAYPSPYVIERRGYKPKTLALTFDDGPDEKFTPMVLDALKKLKVPATFFVIGKNAEESPDLVRRMVDEGHEVGSHTFTHPNLGLVSSQRVELELNATQRALESITGRSTILFRPPYNADAEPSSKEEVKPIIQATGMGYLTIQELIDPEDWLLQRTNPDGTVTKRRAKDFVDQINQDIRGKEGGTILLHDAGGDRTETVKALEMLVPELQAKGYKFVSVSEMAGISHDQAMPPIAAADRFNIWVDSIVFNLVFGVEAFLAIAFLVAIALGLSRIVLTTPLAVLYESRKRNAVYPAREFDVAVLIAAYNEHSVIARTIRSALGSNYNIQEVIVIDDGSTDETSAVVASEFSDDPRVRLIRQENGGKASALNNGLENTNSEILVCVDADTQLDPEAIGLMARHFCDDEVAAVAGNVRVGNEINLLTRWQSIEYTTSQNLDRRAYALLNAITVCPGAISAWRRSAVQESGGYLSDTLAEDMDLTWRVREQGWILETESAAIAFTEAPASVKPFFKQRYRWAYGTLQCLWKHKRSLFKNGFFGWLALPSLWLFQVVFQALAPLVDIQLLYSVWGYADAWLGRNSANKDYQPLSAAQDALMQVAFLYALFFAVEMIAAVIAYRLEKRSATPALWLFWQRFVYRQIMYAVIYKAFASALGGMRQGWGKIDRKATVHLPEGKKKASPENPVVEAPESK